MESQRIKSVIELAKYKVGDILYWVAFRPVGVAGIQIPLGDEWLANCHPKVLYDRKLVRKAWRYRSSLPRLCAIDFQYVVDLLTSEPIVEEFQIHTIHRSQNTGEFYYSNKDADWLPESFLLTTITAAKREKARIKQLFYKWSQQSSDDEV